MTSNRLPRRFARLNARLAPWKLASCFRIIGPGYISGRHEATDRCRKCGFGEAK